MIGFKGWRDSAWIRTGSVLTGGALVTRIDCSIDIKSPRDKVFAYVADVGNQADWVKWAKDVEAAESARVGATDFMVMQVGPTRTKVEGMITELVSGYTVCRRVTRGMEMTERMSVLPAADGTRFAWSVEYTPPMGPAGRAMDFLFMATLFDQLMKDSLDILKQKLEGK